MGNRNDPGRTTALHPATVKNYISWDDTLTLDNLTAINAFKQATVG
jgi:hypothetical protein